jgi:hypothetical protein
MAMARRSAVAVPAVAAALLGTLIAAPGAGADPYVPAWRNFTPGDRMDAAPGDGGAPWLRLTSHRGGLAGIDQIVSPVPRRFTIRVRGRVVSGRADLALEWTEGSGRVLREVTRTLALESGVARARFTSPRAADAVRVAVVQAEGGGVLELDAVELRGAPDGSSLANEGLLLAGCPTDNTRPVAPLGTRTVPGWERADDDMWFSVVGRRDRRSPPLRLVTAGGPGRLLQSVRVPNAPITIVVEGRHLPGGGVVAAELRRAGQEATLLDAAYPLRLRGGRQTVRVRPPAVAGPLELSVGVGPNRPGSIVLDRVAAESGGRDLLANPDLDVRPCGAAPVSPQPADALSPWIRWPVTGLSLVLAGLLLFLLMRIRRTPRAPAPPPIGRWTRLAFLAAVALAPFVAIGTVKVGMRIVPADWLFTALAVVVLASRPLRSAAVGDRARTLAIVSAIALAVTTGVSLVLAVQLWTDPNFAGLAVRERVLENIGAPAARGAVEQLRLVQGVACLVVVCALVNTRAAWLSVARVVALVGAVVAVYGMYQVGAERAFGSVPQPPWAYPTGGLRAGGTFPEPTAFAGFLVFAAACAAAVWQLRRSWTEAAALVVILGGIAASRSTVGLVGIAALAVSLVVLGRFRAATVVLVPAVLAVVVIATVGIGDRWREVYTKPFGVSDSLLDREAVWRAAARMGAEYAPIGVGRGQFAYNQAPFVDPRDADRGGRANSAILELWAEGGPLGLLFAGIATLVGPLVLLVRRRAHAPPLADRAVVWAIATSFIAVMALYYTTTYAWMWVAVGLLATAPLALARGGPGVRWVHAARYGAALADRAPAGADGERMGAGRGRETELAARATALDRRERDLTAYEAAVAAREATLRHGSEHPYRGSSRRRWRLPAPRLRRAWLAATAAGIAIVCAIALVVVLARSYDQFVRSVEASNAGLDPAAVRALAASASEDGGDTILVIEPKGGDGAPDTLRMLLVRSDPRAGTLSGLDLPARVRVPVQGTIAEDVVVPLNGTPAHAITAVERLLDTPIDHVAVVGGAGFAAFESLIGTGRVGFARYAAALSGLLHAGDAGREIERTVTSDLDPAEWRDLAGARRDASGGVRCALGESFVADRGRLRLSVTERGRAALATFLGERAVGTAETCRALVLPSRVSGPGPGLPEALAGLMLLAILTGVVAGVATLLAGRRPPPPAPRPAPAPAVDRPQDAPPRALLFRYSVAATEPVAPARSDDPKRRSDRHEPIERTDVPVSHPDAAVGDASRDEGGQGGPVDSDEAAGGPVADGGAGARAEGDGSIERTPVADEPVPDVEPPAGGGRAGGADSDRRAPDGAAGAEQGRAEGAGVDNEAGAAGDVAAQRRAGHPPRPG